MKFIDVTDEELIDEIISRFDDAFFVGAKCVSGNKPVVTYNHTDSIPDRLYGLAEEFKYQLNLERSEDER